VPDGERARSIHARRILRTALTRSPLMPDPSTDPLMRTLAGVLRERLMAREDVEVPGLGTFCVRHEPSRVQANEQGVALLPPCDSVDFKPASTS
jgi:nucleoid DNA-binding protein